MNNALVLKVVGIVRQKLKEQELKPRHSHQTIEQILNESGICGLGPQPMAEFRAEIYHALGMGLCQPGTLKESLQGFIVDYQVFSVSELRYYFPGDLEAEIYSNLTELGYALKTLVGAQEPVWRPKGMQRHTVKRKLEGRAKIGNPEYLAYLSYKPPQRKNTIVKH
ncbi:hypothetical protein [Thalassomonas haliotis]|uniref:Uncharacterized protein n=1 Tax=Thalassomonas haliotis TaxID=485448 RepID=A0ABY7VH21_9GAMM|nr:hypothetical protein [Thalassomonas haliotis]WDE12340.1 hypothetical protein H3N35_02310 [Thalassomonas haliotis]